MEKIKKLGSILGFNRKRSEFELLETESGAPGFFRENKNRVECEIGSETRI